MVSLNEELNRTLSLEKLNKDLSYYPKPSLKLTKPFSIRVQRRKVGRLLQKCLDTEKDSDAKNLLKLYTGLDHAIYEQMDSDLTNTKL